VALRARQMATTSGSRSEKRPSAIITVSC
jgi:hypothetical protein